MQLTTQDKQSFWSKVNKTDGCWLWLASKQKTGYGQFGRDRGGEKEMWYAHRLSYELVNGPVPDDLFICHTCDNRACVRPDHLYAGTQKDNMRDMFQRKRGAGRNGYVTNTKLCEDDVKEIRKQLSAGKSGRFIAAAFGVTPTLISYVKTGKIWAWVK